MSEPVTVSITSPVNASFGLPNGASVSVYLPNVESDQKAAIVAALGSIIDVLQADEG